MALMMKASEPTDYLVYEDDGGFVAVNLKYKVSTGLYPTLEAAWEYIEQNCKREAAEDAAASIDIPNELEPKRNGCRTIDRAT